MNICLISDTHGHTPDLPLADLLIHCGDICGTFSWFLDQPHRYKLLIPGNHDERLASKNYPEALDPYLLLDRTVEIEGIRIHGSPWTPPFGRWWFMEPEAKLGERYSKVTGPIDILATHGPAYGKLDLTIGSEHAGSRALRDLGKRLKPALHVHGHIHESGGFSINDWGGYGMNVSACDVQNNLTRPPVVIPWPIDP